jgi:hypothetical protein
MFAAFHTDIAPLVANQSRPWDALRAMHRRDSLLVVIPSER